MWIDHLFVAVLKSRGTGMGGGGGGGYGKFLFICVQSTKKFCWSVSLFSGSCGKGQEMVVEVVCLWARGEVQTTHSTILVPLQVIYF